MPGMEPGDFPERMDEGINDMPGLMNRVVQLIGDLRHYRTKKPTVRTRCLRTCNMRDIISQSALDQPKQLRWALEDAARILSRRSAAITNRTDKAAALDMANNIRRIGAEINVGDLHVDELTNLEVNMVFAVAAQLRLLPDHIQAAIAAKGYGPAKACAQLTANRA